MNIPAVSEVLPVLPKIFSGKAFDPVSNDRRTHLFRYGNPQSASFHAACRVCSDEIRILSPPSDPVQMEELGPLEQSVRFGE
jgi:hypothetical protein